MATIVPQLSAIPTNVASNGGIKPGNGLCVFFWDAKEEFYPGGIGSSLGYSNYQGPLAYRSTTVANSAVINGIRGGYVGVGLDVRGDFSTTDHGKTGLSAFQRQPHTNNAGHSVVQTPVISDKSPNSICVRMSELSTYNVHSVSPNLSTFPLTSDPYHERYANSPAVTLMQQVTSRDDINFKTVRVMLQNDGQRIRVDIKGSDGVFYPYHVADLDYKLGQSRIPIERLRVGLAFTTSDDLMDCDIKNLTIQGNFVNYEKNQTKLSPSSGISLSAVKL